MIEAAGNKPKTIQEFFGRAASQTSEVSIARMQSPPGWEEPGQIPEFDEYTIVLSGTLRVETKKDDFYVHKHQAIMVGRGEWVRYSTPGEEGAEYVAVCIPAFSPETVNRDHQNPEP
jgi:mannose-6-phosphate isomerase-like protein (cupin superfamily)